MGTTLMHFRDRYFLHPIKYKLQQVVCCFRITLIPFSEYLVLLKDGHNKSRIFLTHLVIIYTQQNRQGTIQKVRAVKKQDCPPARFSTVWTDSLCFGMIDLSAPPFLPFQISFPKQPHLKVLCFFQKCKTLKARGISLAVGKHFFLTLHKQVKYLRASKVCKTLADP